VVDGAITGQQDIPGNGGLIVTMKSSVISKSRWK